MVSSGSEIDDDTEVHEIKRAMREARLRKKSITKSIRSEIDRDNQVKSEMEVILRTTAAKLEQAKKKAAEYEFDLREARYELHQLNNSYNKLKEEKSQQENMHRREMQDVQERLSSQMRLLTEKSSIISIECEKVARLLANYCHTNDATKRTEGVSKSKKHLLDKAITTLAKAIKIAGAMNENDEIIVTHKKQSKTKQAGDVDTAVDHVMLDMCHNLEEENISLINEVESLKEQLANAKRESAASQLIPHYRLAIVRSRTYAAALQEDIEREKATSQSLREQLDETYRDLKKVVEDKRKLYKKINQENLQAQQDAYGPTVEEDVKEATGRGRSPAAGRTSQNSTTAEKSASHSYQYRDNKVLPERSESPFSHAHKKEVQEERKRRVELEMELQGEIKTLDDHIDILKEKLSRAAVAQSQKILSEVITSSLSELHKDFNLEDF